MRRLGLICGIQAGVLFFSFHTLAQNSSLDVLDQELSEAKKDHQDAASEVVVDMLNELDSAYQSPDAALTLYQKAGGPMPDPTPITTQNAYETPDEKAVRLAQDQANASSLAYVVQLHCGLMRFASLFIIQPDKKGLHEEWIAWLKSAAQTYPFLKQNQEVKPAAPRVGAGGGGGGGGGGNTRRRQGQGQGQGRGGGGGPDYRGVAVKDSIISSYLGFHGWGDKEQGQWSVHDLPGLYRKEILDPLRVSPSAETLAAWDAYIAMKNADESDNDKWNNVEYPTLEFDRDCDDYAITRTMEKLATLVKLVKDNPTHPKFDEWHNRVKQMVDDYRKAKGGGEVAAPTPTPTPTPTDSSTPSGPVKT